MRTTIELSDSQRAKLLELAAERGAKGFSELVREAIDHYLAENAARRTRIDAAIAALGSLSARQAEALDESVRRLRRTWR
jgi:metal-responsive CopG/Arc/MetJ family transcriptional regulator